ncbi:hypothetical protein C8R45DRAFT_1151907 [Mycena sanguinolenta]|nr:hypothetical protein C8R45DRAFT_1151907 [Mycena sanguinolenta]
MARPHSSSAVLDIAGHRSRRPSIHVRHANRSWARRGSRTPLYTQAEPSTGQISPFAFVTDPIPSHPIPSRPMSSHPIPSPKDGSQGKETKSKSGSTPRKGADSGRRSLRAAEAPARIRVCVYYEGGCFAVRARRRHAMPSIPSPQRKPKTKKRTKSKQESTRRARGIDDPSAQLKRARVSESRMEHGSTRTGASTSEPVSPAGDHKTARTKETSEKNRDRDTYLQISTSRPIPIKSSQRREILPASPRLVCGAATSCRMVDRIRRYKIPAKGEQIKKGLSTRARASTSEPAGDRKTEETKKNAGTIPTFKFPHPHSIHPSRPTVIKSGQRRANLARFFEGGLVGAAKDAELQPDGSKIQRKETKSKPESTRAHACDPSGTRIRACVELAKGRLASPASPQATTKQKRRGKTEERPRTRTRTSRIHPSYANKILRCFCGDLAWFAVTVRFVACELVGRRGVSKTVQNTEKGMTNPTKARAGKNLGAYESASHRHRRSGTRLSRVWTAHPTRDSTTIHAGEIRV